MWTVQYLVHSVGSYVRAVPCPTLLENLIDDAIVTECSTNSLYLTKLYTPYLPNIVISQIQEKHLYLLKMCRLSWSFLPTVVPFVEGKINIFTPSFPVFNLVNIYSSSDHFDTDDQLFFLTASTQ